MFKKRNGYDLNLSNPTTFKEKVCWKMIYDRNPLLPLIADKYKVRFFVKSRVGNEIISDLLIPQYFVFKNPKQIFDIPLPKSFVLKANYGSGYNVIVKRLNSINIRNLYSEIKKWDHSYADDLSHQWAYKQIDKTYIVEKYISSSENEPLYEFKFYMIHGNCELIHYISDRFNNKFSIFLDPKNELVFDSKDNDNLMIIKNLLMNYKNKMLQVSKKLSSGFDFIRVDLYLCDGKIYFGELTNYPGSIFKEKITSEIDENLGNVWDIDKYYWVKK